MGFPYQTNDVLAAADLNKSSGLVLVKSQDIIGPTASVTVTNAFSSTFDNYRITVNVDGSANGIGYEFQLGSATTGYYWTGSYLTLSGGPTRFVGNNAAYFNMGVTGANHDSMAVADVFWPYQGLRTSYINHSTGSGIYYTSAGLQEDFTSFTDFTIFIISPWALNAGTIRVYGYNNG